MGGATHLSARGVATPAQGRALADRKPTTACIPAAWARLPPWPGTAAAGQAVCCHN